MYKFIMKASAGPAEPPGPTDPDLGAVYTALMGYMKEEDDEAAISIALQVCQWLEIAGQVSVVAWHEDLPAPTMLDIFCRFLSSAPSACASIVLSGLRWLQHECYVEDGAVHPRVYVVEEAVVGISTSPST
jgi:hypothetical protein